jgi:mono/diheme cytochrome c family protein
LCSACQEFALARSTESAGRIFAPQVLVDPGNREQPSGGYGGDGFFDPEVSGVAVIDVATEEPLEESLTVKQDLAKMAGGKARPDCLLPRAAAVDAPRGALFVTCFGIDAVLELDARAADPRAAERRRWNVAAGPSGIAVDGKVQRAVVWSQFDRTLQVIPLEPEGAADGAVPASRPVSRIALSRKAGAAATDDLALGRKLFHAVSDTRISRDGRACASCHPDGREDSLTWATPDGPRQTPMLAGRLSSTAPYGWNGAGEDVEEHLQHTFERLGGTGLPAREMQALVAFATGMRAPAAKGRDSDTAVARGAEIFHSRDAGCASCHVADGTTTDHAPHDVGSRVRGDGASAFDTPSLRFISGTAPYFHDGRYPTLRALLLDSDGKMGRTSHLSKPDMDALEAYMRSL